MSPRVAVLLAAVLFGTTGTAQALGPDGAAPLTVGAARIVVGGALRCSSRAPCPWQQRPGRGAIWG